MWIHDNSMGCSPGPSLYTHVSSHIQTHASARARFRKAKEVTKGVFGALAKCVKNLEPANDPDLVSAVLAELKKVDGKRDFTTAMLSLVVLVMEPKSERNVPRGELYVVRCSLFFLAAYFLCRRVYTRLQTRTNCVPR